ncbi:MAG: hypothetical protein AAF598_20055 [Bacteroidota bacterium]
MKKTTLFVGLFALVLASFLTFSAFKTPTEVSTDFLYVRVFESDNGLYPASVIVSDGSSIIQKTKLKSSRPRNVEENSMIIAKILNDLHQEGYSVESATSGGNENFIHTDYIFLRK